MGWRLGLEMLDVFLINLDGSDARLAHAKAALDVAGIGFQRIAAFDGRGKQPGQLPMYDEARALRVFGRMLSGGEVGCFLSHLAAARDFLAGEAEFGLVLEDDLSVAPRAKVALAQIMASDCGSPWWVANLGEPARHWFTPVADLEGGHALVRAHYFPVTTTAILWNRAGAAAFVRDARTIEMPVDHWLRRWATQARCGLAVNPALFPPTEMQSEIDGPSAPKSGRKAGHGLHYGLTKYRRMWANKRRARAACAAYVKDRQRDP